MALSKEVFSQYIHQFNFKELFNDMGWNNDKTSQPIVVDNITFILQSVAEKSGFKILLCNPTSEGSIPDYTLRRKIETKVTKLFQEHLIIFYDVKKQNQIWQLVVRQTGRPTKVTETRYNISKDPQLLYQRASGLFFELDEEEKITIVDVTRRVSDNFYQNNEKVTKQFYERFKKEHTSFLSFIKGIDDKISDKDNQQKHWYASLMLNRLMFCYFIQKKGFLDDNKNYLRDKLKACKAKKGKNQFYSFYRDFLLVLFHQGLNEAKQKAEIKVEIGKIPYLNGGLFDVHELEIEYKKIDISDNAFEKLFDFFDQYEWHLDTRITASGKDVNPDVIGYIFEKYINDRSQMGAYYTKEDITEYISKNCILPYLFDETKRQYPKAFTEDAEIWHNVKQSDDIYIYDAVKKGANESIPKDISAGIKDISKRNEWNKPAPENFALPTEIWREVIDRRNRYCEIKAKIANGELQSINDFITYNLNIRQFTQDIIENTNDPEFLKSFYKSLNNITIIDPTCGSGAFLFAAMNILEPLYEACIQRMEIFISESQKGKYKFFEETLQYVKAPEHPNLQYFIFKNIILRNLYGVDIMKEAVEIAKLRLFLKLVATVEADYRKPNLGLEPLPDIDFNIRSGNTLVGFATEKELEKSLVEDLMGALVKQEIEEKCDIVAHAFQRYKEIQLSSGDDYKNFKDAKDELNKRLKELNNELNLLLHKQSDGIKYEKWLESYKPFHWFAEFYEIIHDKSGFDCIIGNPPYVEYSVTRKSYTLTNGQYKTEKAGNLFAFVMEKCLVLSNTNGKIGMIIPLSAFCTARMEVMNDLFSQNCSYNYISYYGFRPAKLFEGASRTIGIGIFDKTKYIKQENKFFTTAYRKWSSDYRQYLFETINYFTIRTFFLKNQYPKIEQTIEHNILEKLFSKKKTVANYVDKSVKSNCIFYRNVGGLYWKIITNFPPKFFEDGKASSSSRESHLFINSKNNLLIILALYNSNLFWYYYNMTSDCWSLNPSDLINIPLNIDELNEKQKSLIIELIKDLMADLNKNAIWAERIHKGKNSTRFQQFTPRLSKPIIDKIDKVLAEHYGFTAEELDFIINYDIKYRMGKELEGDEGE